MKQCKKFSHTYGSWHSIFLVVTLTFLSMAAIADDTEYRIVPRPEWILDTPIPTPERIPENAISNGSFLLLVDIQANPKGQYPEHFRHYAEQVVNQEGVEYVSQISINFDPTYEMLLLHNISVHRAGQEINKLLPENLSLLQREEDLEYQIYDGSKTLNAILEDIRVGDILEYSYTIRGANPVFEGLYYRQHGLQWRVPLHRWSLRILWPQDVPLYITPHGLDISPDISVKNGVQEYLFIRENISAIIPDSDLPSWFSPYPWLQLSEAATWADVAQWGVRLYPLPQQLSPELKAQVQAIRTEHDQPEEQLIAALRFVQDHIRYMGIEIGPSSHRPHAPAVVLQRRFGDCKDKAFLLQTLLYHLGISSSPALVNTYEQQEIREWPPTPYAFNHVILVVTLGDKTYWLDPTRSYQGGSLRYTYPADYGMALVLHETTTDLTPIPPPEVPLPEQEVEERFIVRDDPEPATDYTITTIFRGSLADYKREIFATESINELEKSYLNYYAELYPDIQTRLSMTIHDQYKLNKITVKESYSIPNFWHVSDDEQELEAEFYPLDLHEQFDEPETRQRSMPLYVPYPLFYKHTTHVQFIDDWDIEPYSVHIEDRAARFDHTITYRNRQMKMEYEYQTLTDHVNASDAQQYLTNIERIKDELGYYLSQPIKSVATSSETRDVSESQPLKDEQLEKSIAEEMPRDKGATYDDLNWTILLLALFTLGFGIFAASKVYAYAPNIPTTPLWPYDSYLQGIRGWLLLVAFGVCMNPIQLLRALVSTLPAYSHSQWNALTTPGTEAYHVLWQPLLIFELLFNLLTVVFSILMVILFFQKRYTFPKVYTLFLFANFIGPTLDFIVGQGIPFLHEQYSPNDKVKLLQRGLIVLIWTLYFAKSRRVKWTFTKTISGRNLNEDQELQNIRT